MKDGTLTKLICSAISIEYYSQFLWEWWGSRQFYNIFDKRSIDEVTAAMKLLAIVMYVVQVTKEPIMEFVVVTKRFMNGIYAL